MKVLRVYVDMSVLGGLFDEHLPERVAQARLFWQSVADGTLRIIVSDVLDEELVDAPQCVKDFLVPHQNLWAKK